MSVSLSLLFSPRHHAGWLHLVAKAVTPSLFFHCSFTLLLPHMSYIPVPSPSSPYLPSSPSYFFLSHLTFTFIIFFLFHLTPPSHLLPVPSPSSPYLPSSTSLFLPSSFSLLFPHYVCLISSFAFFAIFHSFTVLSASSFLLPFTSSFGFIALPYLITFIVLSLLSQLTPPSLRL